jgi:hypothetical protein
VVLPATPFLFFFFLLKTKANLKLQNLEFENSDRHEINFVGKSATRAITTSGG